MEYRRLPHWQKMNAAYFVTWRLHGSLPTSRVADLWTSDGAKFAAEDRLLDAGATGPRWLRQADVAQSVIGVLVKGQCAGDYDLGSWVLMPNHVHLILRPYIDLARAIGTIKGRSARHANAILSLGGPFWARDYFDRWIRGREEESRIVRYIEQNPVKAGLCATPEEWRWSSAYAAKAACPDGSRH